MRLMRTLAISAAVGVLPTVILWQMARAPAVRAVPRGADAMERSELEGDVRAPDFPDGLQWLNAERPLSLRDLRGKVVLLDFWTYCCINCMHVLPDLKRLERKYGDALAVVGVHSAKFSAERDTENIRQAVLRYDVEHPVVNDASMRIWRDYGVRAWPTLVLIDPRGRVIGANSGEGVYLTFNDLIGRVIGHFEEQGLIDRTPLATKLERDALPPSALSFPGKVLADESSGRLFVADSGHNRIVVADLSTAAPEHIIGTGEVGMDDGSYEEATFNHPQGLALSGDVLYVADTENHAIRAVDLSAGRVTTIAGTGSQAVARFSGGPAGLTPLNSPWDLVFHDGRLYIAMAGPHQLWVMDIPRGRVEPYAGSGREARVDGPLRRAALAQPSGLATDGRLLYFADSEVSSVRSADLDPVGEVRTIVGGDLFDFGDRDGVGLSARLQHPLGVAWHDGALYVADTYNNKIKRVDVAQSRIETLLGTGEEGSTDGLRATFDEPSGLSAAGRMLYIADTNNHAVRVADLRTLEVRTLRFPGLRPPVAGEPEPAVETVTLTEEMVAPGDVRVTVSLTLPDGLKPAPGAPTSVAVFLAEPGADVDYGSAEAVPVGSFPYATTLTVPRGSHELIVDLWIYACGVSDDSACFLRQARLVVPLSAEEGAVEREVDVRFAPTDFAAPAGPSPAVP